MADIMGKKIGGSTLLTIFVAGATKTLEERLLAPVIGNGTVLSGVIKLAAGGFVLPWIEGKYKENSIVKGVNLGFGVDGIEDIIQGIFFGGGIWNGGPSLNILGGGNTQAGF